MASTTSIEDITDYYPKNENENFENHSTFYDNASNDTEEGDYYEYYYDYDMEEIARVIYMTGQGTILIVGTIGNLLAFYVMRQGSLKHVSTCFYMSILALADTGLLWTEALSDFIAHYTYWETDIHVFSDCKPGKFLYYTCAHMSSSLLSIMSVEKFIALYFPLKTKSICTVRTAKWVTGVAFFILAGFNSQFFFDYGVREHPRWGYKYCTFIGVPDSYKLTYNRIDSTLYTFAPFTIMILANSAIIYKFMKAKYYSKKQGTESTSQALNNAANKGTAMLITVSLTFIILTGPISITYAILDDSDDSNLLLDAIVVTLYYSNHGINGILYCIVGSRFRNELGKAIRRCFCCKTKDSLEDKSTNYSQATRSMSLNSGDETKSNLKSQDVATVSTREMRTTPI